MRSETVLASPPKGGTPYASRFEHYGRRETRKKLTPPLTLVLKTYSALVATKPDASTVQAVRLDDISTRYDWPGTDCQCSVRARLLRAIEVKRNGLVYGLANTIETGKWSEAVLSSLVNKGAG